MNSSKRKKKENIWLYLKKLFVRERHNSLKYDYTGTIHILLHKEERKIRVFKAESTVKAASRTVSSAFTRLKLQLQHCFKIVMFY